MFFGKIEIFCKKDRNGHTGKVNKSQHGFEKRHFKELGVCVRAGRSAHPLVQTGLRLISVQLALDYHLKLRLAIYPKM